MVTLSIKNYKNFKVSDLGVILVFLLILFFHIWKIDQVPSGLYVDEASIGYNASLLAESGRDEHGVAFPLFFEAFGEYKNPIYIYATALIFKLFGVSELNLRLTSFLFFTVFLGSVYLLSNLLFRNKIINIYALIAAGFMPWFFNISRISFEVISQLSFTAFSLLLVFLAYSRNKLAYSIAAGLVSGLTFYTYSTSRLLSFMFMASVFGIFIYKNATKTLLITLIFASTLYPTIIFVKKNPEALLYRFNDITYLTDQESSARGKSIQFLNNYKSYLSFNYLFLEGDSNLRNHISYNGQVFPIIFVLFLAGVLGFFLSGYREIKDKFFLLFLINLILSPVAAALTSGDSSIRSILIGIYILFLSLYGFQFILSKKKVGSVLVVIIFLSLGYDSFRYLNFYFSEFPAISIEAFGGHDFKNSLRSAIEFDPEKIIISDIHKGTYVYPAFYGKFIDNNKKVPIINSKPIPGDNVCIILSALENNFRTPSFGLISKDLTTPDSLNKVICFARAGNK